MPHRATFLALCLLTAGCLRWPGPTTAPQTLALFGGHEGYELIHIPALARVELFRLAENPATTPPAAPRIGNAPISAGPASLDDATLKQLSLILRDSASYDWSASPRSPARPTVALRFTGARKTLDLLFSFTDNTLTVYESTRPIAQASFAPRAADLATLLRPPTP